MKTGEQMLANIERIAAKEAAARALKVAREAVKRAKYNDRLAKIRAKNEENNKFGVKKALAYMKDAQMCYDLSVRRNDLEEMAADRAKLDWAKANYHARRQAARREAEAAKLAK